MAVSIGTALSRAVTAAAGIMTAYGIGCVAAGGWIEITPHALAGYCLIVGYLTARWPCSAPSTPARPASAPSDP